MPTTTITIQDLPFTVPVPYAEGHVITAGEAAALNQVYHENIRNNFAKQVKSNGGLDQAGLQARLDAYTSTYVLKGRPGGLSAATPLQREAQKIAKAQVDTALAAKGLKKDQLREGRYDELIAEVSGRDAVLAEAKRRLDSLQNAAQVSLDLEA